MPHQLYIEGDPAGPLIKNPCLIPKFMVSDVMGTANRQGCEFMGWISNGTCHA